MKTHIYSLFLVVATLISCDQIQQSKTHQLRLKGSESMHETFEELAADFEKTQDTIKVSIEGGGSRTGLMAIKNRQAEIGLSSFPFDLDRTLGQSHGVQEQVVAYDAIVVITNRNNTLDSLDDDQINKIYSGEITDWSQLGGRDGAIIPVIRDQNSGTQKFFVEHFGIDQVASSATIAPDNAEIVAQVSNNVNGIGFIGFAYFTQSVHNLSLPGSNSDQFHAPTHRNLENGKYPLKRGLRVYFYDDNNPAVKGFMQYLKTKRAHGIIESYGLIAI